ncbi:atherin-like [Mesocricetus auratus]|uniref:Atherin-like n=1 Tax=Mesocricetus auratus TaxID=10036 RepID=A0ABM2Y1W6_MESAU|nr:atherin-like [Mesocricetus auratus]
MEPPRARTRRQPRLRVPVAKRRLAAAAAAASPRRSSPAAAGAAAAVDVPPPRSPAILLRLAAPLLLRARATAAELGGHSPGHNLASAAVPAAAATTAPASASSPSSSPPPPPAPGPPPPPGPSPGPAPTPCFHSLIGCGARSSPLRRWSARPSRPLLCFLPGATGSPGPATSTAPVAAQVSMSRSSGHSLLPGLPKDLQGNYEES